MTWGDPNNEDGRRKAMEENVRKHAGEREFPFIGWVLLFLWFILISIDLFKSRNDPFK